MLQRWHSGDGCDLASTLCKYDLRKDGLFVLRWAMVRRIKGGSISSELLMCGGDVLSISLLSLVARCLLPRPMEGMGRLQFSDLFTELPVLPQAAGVYETL